MLTIAKYWDSITREDLEFSVGTKQNTWEVKELLADDDHRNTIYQDTEYSSNLYNAPNHGTPPPPPNHGRNSNYGGFAY